MTEKASGPFDPHHIPAYDVVAGEHYVYMAAIPRAADATIPEIPGAAFFQGCGWGIACWTEKDEAEKFVGALRAQTGKPFRLFMARLAMICGEPNPIVIKAAHPMNPIN